MSISEDSTLDTVRSLEDDFADAMSRMYSVGNELARLRSRLATEASPEQWTPVQAPETPTTSLVTPAATAAPTASPAASPAPASAAREAAMARTATASQPSPPPVAPGHVMPPPAPASAYGTAPTAATGAAPFPPSVPPTTPLPPTEPWWQRDGLVAKVLAVVGTAITLIGVAFLLALAIQMGFFGPLARVLSGALLALALVGAAVIVRRRPSGTIGALGLAATGIATAYLDVLAVTRIYEWLPIGVGMAIAGLIALGGVLLARAWDSQLLAVVAVLGVAFMSPFVGLEHGLLTGGFLLVLAAATWPAQIGRQWHVLEIARIVPTALFLTVLAIAAERTGIAALLGILFAALVLGTSIAGARVTKLPQQIGALIPVAIVPASVAALAVDDHWSGAGLFVALTCLLVIVAALADHPEGTPWHLRFSEFALGTAGVTAAAGPRG